VLADACDLTRVSDPDDWARCADRIGLHDVVRMHPADQFWSLQAWETAGFLALAAVFTVATFWWLRHRIS
jgi:hypothetical protein